MKIFLTWSGARSRAVAEALNDWLRRVIQAVRPFYSPDIEKGAKWSSEIDSALEGTRFGIVCLTPDNLESIWVHFEAGALSKTKDALVLTFLHGLSPSDVPPPLSKFQATVAEKRDTLRLLKTINSRLSEVDSEPLADQLLEENFELFWPQLEKRLVAAEGLSGAPSSAKAVGEAETQRDAREILNEILELARNQERRLGDLEERAATQSPRSAKQVKGYGHLSIHLDNDAQDVGLRFSEALQTLTANGVRTLIVPSEEEVVIEVGFRQPLTERQIDRLVDKAVEITGHRVNFFTVY